MLIFLFPPIKGITVIKLKSIKRGEEGLRIKITDYRARTLSKEAQGRVFDCVKDASLPRHIGYFAAYRLRLVLGNVA